MSKYRIGDRVRIKSRKWYNSLKIDGEIDSEIVAFGFNLDMSKYCGKIGIITNVVDTIYRDKRMNKYSLDIDNECWRWSEDMFDLNNNVNVLEIE